MPLHQYSTYILILFIGLSDGQNGCQFPFKMSTEIQHRHTNELCIYCVNIASCYLLVTDTLVYVFLGITQCKVYIKYSNN